MPGTAGRRLDSRERSPPPAMGPTLESDRALRATLIGVGLFALCVFVLIGAVLQPGMAECAICDGNTCGPGSTAYCPNTGPVLAVILGALAIGAVLVAVGVAPRAARSLLALPRPLALNGRAREAATSAPFLALFLLFFGWGVASLGLLLPLPNFGECHEACVYPYVLQGIPLVLAGVGMAAIAAGAVLLARTVTRRRSYRERESTSVRVEREVE